MERPLQIEHARIRVNDLSTAVDFYTDVLGLVELERDDGVVYLGCGLDENFDVAVEAGGGGLDHVAFRLDSELTLEEYEATLERADVDVSRVRETEPGETAGIRFALPSGVPIEYVVVEDTSYHHSDEPGHPTRSGIAPVDFDHINFYTPAMKADVGFLEEYGFLVSEIIETDDDSWIRAFVRCREDHHDLAIGPLTPDDTSDEPQLHHISFKYRGMEHLKCAIDALSIADIDLERGPGRHYAGNNIYAYFWTPSGNRVELTAEMATVSSHDPIYLQASRSTRVAWGASQERDSSTSGLAKPSDGP